MELYEASYFASSELVRESPRKEVKPLSSTLLEVVERGLWVVMGL
jgi:hypothetical protein